VKPYYLQELASLFNREEKFYGKERVLFVQNGERLAGAKRMGFTEMGK